MDASTTTANPSSAQHRTRSVGGMDLASFLDLVSAAAADATAAVLPPAQLSLFNDARKLRTRVDTSNRGAPAQITQLLSQGWLCGNRREYSFKSLAELGVGLRNNARTNTRLIASGIIPPSKAVSFTNSRGDYVELPTRDDFLARANTLLSLGFKVGRKGGKRELKLSDLGFATAPEYISHDEVYAKYLATEELPLKGFHMESTEQQHHTWLAPSNLRPTYVKELLARGYRFGKTQDSAFISVKELDLNPMNKMTVSELKHCGRAMVYFKHPPSQIMVALGVPAKLFEERATQLQTLGFTVGFCKKFTRLSYEAALAQLKALTEV